jgi:hypothetical protein
MVRVEAHGLANAVDALLHLSPKREQPARANNSVGIIGIECDCPLKMPLGAVHITAIPLNET